MVVVDVSAAVHRRAGLGRYAEGLAHALAAAIPGQLGLFYNRERGVEALASLQSIPASSVAMGYKPWRMLVWLGQLARVGFDRLIAGADLYHATEHLLLPLNQVPTILTVHDLIFRRFPEHHKPLNRLYLNATMPLFCRRADRIIAVSQATRRDLLAAYSIPASKVTVVHEAAAARFRRQDPERVAAAKQRYGLPERYVLFVGTIEPRKNLTGLLHAFEEVASEQLTDGLAIVGRPGWLYDDFFGELEASRVSDRVILPGYVADDDLPAIYAGAQVLALPSLYEGFGLPVLEAMACGTPVACSRTSSLAEISGEAALHFDPDEADSIAATLREVLADDCLSVDLRQRGLRHAARFSWERTAAETLAVYAGLMGRHNGASGNPGRGAAVST